METILAILSGGGDGSLKRVLAVDLLGIYRSYRKAGECAYAD
jgi:hypothetical protein